MSPDYHKPISDDLKRMIQEDDRQSSMKDNMESLVSRARRIGEGADSYPELEEMITKTSISFSDRFITESGRYSSDEKFDAYMELHTDFVFDLPETMKEWAEQIAPYSEFQRGCYCTLSWIVGMLDKIEKLRPPEPR